MRINKLFALLAMVVLVFTACEKEEEEPVIVSSQFLGLQQVEYLEGDTVNFKNVYLKINWSNNRNDIYSVNDFANYGIETIPRRGEEISLDQDSVIIVFKELGIKEGIPLNVIKSKVTDYDGNTYNVVKIYDQYWLDKNMATTHYADGTPIPTIKDLNGNGTTKDEWDNIDDNAKVYCYYDDNIENRKYGALYTWAAAMGEGVEVNQGVCPEGFHLPTEDDWDDMLHNILNDGKYEGEESKYLKAKEGWFKQRNGTDDFHFSALPGGYRYVWGGYESIISHAYWWTSSEYENKGAGCAWFTSGQSECEWRIGWGGINNNNALSVRCIKDAQVSTN